MWEFVIIAGSTLLLKNFLHVSQNLVDRMINQAGSKPLLLKQIKKAFTRHPKVFQKYHIMASDIVNKSAAIWNVTDSKGLNKLVAFLGSNGPTCNLN